MSIGIDCGGQKIAIVDLQTNYADVYDVRRKQDRNRVIREMARWVENHSHWIAGRPVFVEAPVLAGARNIQSTIKVAQTTGAVLAGLDNVREVAISSWKKRTVGNGNANKEQVRLWLDVTHPEIAHMCGGNQDLYDAACIALYGQSVLQVEAYG